jgi:hypothetical protein
MRIRWLLPACAVLLVGAGPLRADEAATAPDMLPTAPAVMAAPVGSTAAPARPAPVVMAQGAPPATAPQPEEKKPEPPPPPRFKYGGQADFYYGNNLNDPFNHLNGLAVYDIQDDRGVHLGLIDLWGEYAPDPIGVRLDLNFGPTRGLYNLTERLFSGSRRFDLLQQAYLRAKLDKKGRELVDFGRWVSPVGTEALEPANNWLYSRGVLYGFAEPFSHTGLRYFHYENDTNYWQFVLTQGWDSVSHPGHGPGFGITHNRVLNSKWNFTGTYMGGDELDSRGKPTYRNFVDAVFAYNPSPKMAYTLTLDAGTQGQSQWFGLAGQARRTLNAKQSVAARFEWMRDDTGFRFGTGRNTTAYTMTLNYTHLFNKYMQTRVEYRHDFSPQGIFFGDTPGTLRDNQGRFTIAAILTY